MFGGLNSGGKKKQPSSKGAFSNLFGKKKTPLMNFDSKKAQQANVLEKKTFVIPQDTNMIETGSSNKQFEEVFEYQEFSADELAGRKNAAMSKYQLGIQFQDEHKVPEAIEVYREAVSPMYTCTNKQKFHYHGVRQTNKLNECIYIINYYNICRSNWTRHYTRQELT